MQIDIVIKLDPTLQQTLTLLASTLSADNNLEIQKMAASLQDIKNQVSANTSLVQSAIALIQGLAQKLQEALNANDPAAVQAIVDEMRAQDEQLANAIANNTPAQTIAKQQA